MPASDVLSSPPDVQPNRRPHLLRVSTSPAALKDFLNQDYPTSHQQGPASDPLLASSMPWVPDTPSNLRHFTTSSELEDSDGNSNNQSPAPLRWDKSKARPASGRLPLASRDQTNSSPTMRQPQRRRAVTQPIEVESPLPCITSPSPNSTPLSNEALFEDEIHNTVLPVYTRWKKSDETIVSLFEECPGYVGEYAEAMLSWNNAFGMFGKAVLLHAANSIPPDKETRERIQQTSIEFPKMAAFWNEEIYTSVQVLGSMMEILKLPAGADRRSLATAYANWQYYTPLLERLCMVTKCKHFCFKALMEFFDNIRAACKVRNDYYRDPFESTMVSICIGTSNDLEILMEKSQNLIVTLRETAKVEDWLHKSIGSWKEDFVVEMGHTRQTSLEAYREAFDMKRETIDEAWARQLQRLQNFGSYGLNVELQKKLDRLKALQCLEGTFTSVEQVIEACRESLEQSSPPGGSCAEDSQATPTTQLKRTRTISCRTGTSRARLVVRRGSDAQLKDVSEDVYELWHNVENCYAQMAQDIQSDARYGLEPPVPCEPSLYQGPPQPQTRSRIDLNALGIILEGPDVARRPYSFMPGPEDLETPSGSGKSPQESPLLPSRVYPLRPNGTRHRQLAPPVSLNRYPNVRQSLERLSLHTPSRNGIVVTSDLDDCTGYERMPSPRDTDDFSFIDSSP